MGQKINPIIFRLGVNKTWKTEFFEKKSNELPLYTFKDLEIKNYLERVLEINGILLHEYKQYYNESSLNLYISYFITPEGVTNKKEVIETIRIKNSNEKYKIVKRALIDYNVSKPVKVDRFVCSKLLRSFQSYKIKKYLASHFNKSSQVQLNKFIKEEQSKHDSQSNGVFDSIFKVLSLLMNNQFKIILNLCCLNKENYFLTSTQKKAFIPLQRFKNSPFFKQGMELLFQVAYNGDSGDLLAKFIVLQLKKTKRQKFLLSFLKQALTVMISLSLAKIKGIKVTIKGRLNGRPRATHKTIVIGDVPVQTISAELDYSQSTAHNSNGSYGVKVWIIKK